MLLGGLPLLGGSVEAEEGDEDDAVGVGVRVGLGLLGVLLVGAAGALRCGAFGSGLPAVDGVRR